MSPKEIKSTNSAETEKVTDKTAEQRRADQDAAIEEALLAGTLPNKDRRASGQPPPVEITPTLGDPNPSTVVTSRAIPAGRRQFIGPDGTQVDVSVAKKEEHGLGRILASLPPNSTATWTNATTPGGEWTVTRGSVNAVGHGPTLRRAVRMVGAKMGRHPEDQLRQVLLDEHDRPIHPHLDTDPDPADPTDQPKTVDGEGNVVTAVSAADSSVKPAVVETEESKK